MKHVHFQGPHANFGGFPTVPPGNNIDIWQSDLLAED